MGILLIGVLLALMVVGIPIAFSIELSGIIFLLVTNMKSMIVVAQRLFMGMTNYTLIAIPLFTFSGYLMESGGLSRRLVDWVNKFFGWFWGSMGTVTIVCCTIFAALTGSGPATVAAIGAIMIPSMRNNGYTKEASAGILASAGALGPIIPPSVVMIVYGTTMNLSIPDMFMGGVVPGLTIALGLITVNTVYAVRHDIKPIKIKYTAKQLISSTVSAFGVLMLPVIVLGGIYGGIFTPTEAAAVCVVYSLLLGVIYRELTLESLVSALKRTIETSAMVILITGMSGILGWLLSAAQIPRAIAEAILPYIGGSQTIYILLLLAILFAVGCIMETLAAVVIIAPILVPIGLELGMDPLHLGLVFCIALIVGYITPPFGCNLFTASAVAEVSYAQVLKGVLPYLAMMATITIVLAFIPSLSIWLPNILKG